MVYSIRMRSAQGGPHEKGGYHISGAERIVTKEELGSMATSLIERALTHDKGKADFISIRIDRVNEENCKVIACLNWDFFEGKSVEEGRSHAKEFLMTNHIEEEAVEKAFSYLISMDGNMRGALLLNSQTGERLDQGGARGIRVTKMDFTNAPEAVKQLAGKGLCGIHALEAIVLASKVLSCPGVVGELCWSDDPFYQVGYVTGYTEKGPIYHRIMPLKEQGTPQGGRVFFVEPTADLTIVQNYLEEQFVLVDYKEAICQDT